MRQLWSTLLLVLAGCQGAAVSAPATTPVAPGERSDSGFCPVAAERLASCAQCDGATREQARRALVACRGGCPDLEVSTQYPVVPPSLIGLQLGDPVAFAESRCVAVGGQWNAPGYCRAARGPWGLDADWEVTSTDGVVDRIEVVYSAAPCGGETEALGGLVGQLVSESLGAPTYRAPGHHAWMPEQGAYVAVLVDPGNRAVRLWVKQQL